MKIKTISLMAVMALGMTFGDGAQSASLSETDRQQQEIHEMRILEENPCTGTAATLTDIVQVMRPGELTKSFGAHGGADLPMYSRHRTCTATTGCTEWQRGALELDHRGLQMAVLEIVSDKTATLSLNSRTAYGGNTPTSCELLNGEVHCRDLSAAIVYYSAGEPTHGTPTGSYSRPELTKIMGSPVQLSGRLTNSSPIGDRFEPQSGLCLWLKSHVERLRGNYRDESELVYFQSGINQSMVAPAW